MVYPHEKIIARMLPALRRASNSCPGKILAASLARAECPWLQAFFQRVAYRNALSNYSGRIILNAQTASKKMEKDSLVFSTFCGCILHRAEHVERKDFFPALFQLSFFLIMVKCILQMRPNHITLRIIKTTAKCV
jgi:hypothetical protein